jgi:hypothetical protein
MPKVTFVNERRTVEAKKGLTIAQVAEQAGVAICREEFVGTGIGNYTCWVKAADGALSPPDWWERFKGAKGPRRFANRVLVLGDVEVTTQGGLSNRLRTARVIDAPPTPKTDANAARLGVSAAGTAAFPFGNPKEVGKGEREAVARNTGKPKKAGAAAAAEADAEESDESE